MTRDKIKQAIITAVTLMLATLLMPVTSVAAPAVTEQQAYEIGIEAYIYAYPMVLMEVTRRQATNVAGSPTDIGRGPMNQFTHARVFPDASFKDVVRANVDTLYSIAWLELSGEPVILSVPDTGGRYYLVQMLDMWTDVFASPGSRTTGTKAGTFAIVGPNYNGTIPNGMEVINAPTEYVWIIGRIQTNGKQDYENVHHIQEGLKVMPLSKWPGPYMAPKAEIDPTVDMKTPPIEQVTKMDAAGFFSLFAELMKSNPPHVHDYPIIHRMEQIGIVPGERFLLADANPAVRSALERAVPEAQQRIIARMRRLGTVRNNWQMFLSDIGTYGTNYLGRAVIAYGGLGANVVEDAIYPLTFVDENGEQLNGRHRYVLRFEKGRIPPVRAFWSLTMYGSDQFLVDNPLNRYAIGDRDQLKFNPDGSLDLYIQHESPGQDKQCNWLPAPIDDFSLVLRLYWPGLEVMDGTWIPPAVQRVK